MELPIVPCLAAPLWGKKGVSKGKAERRGRGKKEKPTSETRAVPGTNHTRGNGCREAPESLAIE